jgi:transposase
VEVKTISLGLRERILAAYDAGEGTREAVAGPFRVSLGMVKKLLQQRRRTGDMRPQHHRSGRKPGHVARRQQQLRAYSLDLDPIEKMWSKVKQHLRSAEARTWEALVAAIAAALATVAAQDAANWFAHCGYSFI